MNFNPFDGVRIGLGPFADVLKGPIGMLIGLAMALGIVFAIFYLIGGAAALAKARQRNRPMDTEDIALQIVLPLVSIIFILSLPAIYNAVVR